MLSELLERSAVRQDRREQLLVTDPRSGEAQLLRRGIGLLGLALGLACAVLLLPDGWRQSGALVCLTGYLVAGAMQSHRCGHAYWRGYVDARSEMLASFEESARRDMSVEEWLDGELERGRVLFGSPEAELPRA